MLRTELGEASALPVPVEASAAPAFPTIDINAVAAMSREEKLAFMKKLKDERKALYVELGIEEETKATKAAKAAEAAEAMEKAEQAAMQRATATEPTVPPLPGFNAAFKCLGFVFSMNLNVAPEPKGEEEAPSADDAALQTKGQPAPRQAGSSIRVAAPSA